MRGAHAVVFVADSQARAADNKEPVIENLKDQELTTRNRTSSNEKRTPQRAARGYLDKEITHAPTYEACAMRGEGVRETLSGVAAGAEIPGRWYGGGVVGLAPAAMAAPQRRRHLYRSPTPLKKNLPLEV